MKMTIIQLTKEHILEIENKTKEHENLTAQLRFDLRMREKERDMYESKIGVALKDLKKRESILELKSKEHDEQLKLASQSSIILKRSEHLQKKLTIAEEESDQLFRHLTAHVNGLYDRCIKQEKMLNVESLRSIINNEKFHEKEIKKDLKEHNSILAVMIEKLNTGDNVPYSQDWNNALSNETDRISIISELSKRNQIGFDFLNDMYTEQLRQANRTIQQSRQDLDKRIREMKQYYGNQLRLSNKEIKQYKKTNDDLETSFHFERSKKKEIKMQVAAFKIQFFLMKKMRQFDIETINELRRVQINNNASIQEFTKNLEQVIAYFSILF